MSGPEAKKLFAQLNAVLAELKNVKQQASELQSDLSEVKKVVNRVEANWEGLASLLNNHGTDITRLENTVDRLQLRCPMMKPKTDEFCKVGDDDGSP